MQATGELGGDLGLDAKSCRPPLVMPAADIAP